MDGVRRSGDTHKECQQLTNQGSHTEQADKTPTGSETDIHGFQLINPNDFGDPLNFSVAPP